MKLLLMRHGFKAVTILIPKLKEALGRVLLLLTVIIFNFYS